MSSQHEPSYLVKGEAVNDMPDWLGGTLIAALIFVIGFAAGCFTAFSYCK